MYNVVVRELQFCYPLYSAKTENLVDEYKQQCQHFMNSTTVNQFQKLFLEPVAPSNLLIGKVKITVKLEHIWGDSTINDLTRLVEILKIHSENLHLYQIKNGCIAVIWLCSISDVEEQKRALWQANVSPQNMGVLQVFIGEDPMLLSTSDSGKLQAGLVRTAHYNVPFTSTISYGAAVAGATAVGFGGAAGRAVGAFVGETVAIGSVVPGPRTVTGGLIGTGVGAAIGALAGGAGGETSSWCDYDHVDGCEIVVDSCSDVDGGEIVVNRKKKKKKKNACIVT